ncbi:MAG: hypothetical protein ACRDI2_08420 [Chloroflexota bacterium]
MEAVLEHAVAFYVRMKTSDYRKYWPLVDRYQKAPEGSDEKALLREELAAAIAEGHGRKLQRRGGDPAVVLARLRRRAEQAE